MVELIEISDCLKAFKLMDVNSSFFEIDQNKLNYTIVGEAIQFYYYMDGPKHRICGDIFTHI